MLCRTKTFGLLLWFCTLLALCWPSSPSFAVPENAGIFATIYLSPRCERGVQYCTMKPYIGRFAVIKNYAVPVAEIETDANGEFRISLPPGTYQLKPILRNESRPPQITEVIVYRNSFASVTIHLQ